MDDFVRCCANVVKSKEFINSIRAREFFAMTEQKQLNAVKRGRPRAEDAGLVDQRVLDAATELFLSQGFGRTTLDQVSEKSRTGKSSLYGRYANKETLFAAVVTRSIEEMFADLGHVPTGRGRKDRLRHLGLELVRVLLTNRCVALMRIVAAEAATFPKLATLGYHMSFEGSAQAIAQTLAGSGSEEDIKAMLPPACRFIELALQPISFQATFGRPPEELLAKAPRDVEEAITLLYVTGQLTDD